MFSIFAHLFWHILVFILSYTNVLIFVVFYLQAYSIDQTCYVIHNNSNEVSLHGGIGRNTTHMSFLWIQ